MSDDANGVYEPVRSPCCGSTNTQHLEGLRLTCLPCGGAFDHPNPDFYAALLPNDAAQT